MDRPESGRDGIDSSATARVRTGASAGVKYVRGYPMVVNVPATIERGAAAPAARPGPKRVPGWGAPVPAAEALARFLERLPGTVGFPGAGSLGVPRASGGRASRDADARELVLGAPTLRAGVAAVPRGGTP